MVDAVTRLSPRLPAMQLPGSALVNSQIPDQVWRPDNQADTRTSVRLKSAPVDRRYLDSRDPGGFGSRMGAIGRPLWPRFFQTLEESVQVLA